MDGWWCVRYGHALAWVEARSEAAAVRRSLDLHPLGDWTDDARELVVFPQDAYPEHAGPHDYTRAALNAGPPPWARRGARLRASLALACLAGVLSPWVSSTRPQQTRGAASRSPPSTVAPRTTRSGTTPIPSRSSAKSSVRSERSTGPTPAPASHPRPRRTSSTSSLRVRRTIPACVPRTPGPRPGSRATSGT